MSNDTDRLIKAVKTTLDEAVESYEGNLDELKSRLQHLETETLCGFKGSQHRAPSSLAATIAKADNFKHFVNREIKQFGLPVVQDLKSLVNVGAASSNDDAYDTHPERAPGLFNDPRRPLTLLDAFPTQRVSSATFEFIRLNGYTNSAAEQGEEGSAKAETALPTDLKSVRHATIAHWLPASEQVLQDVPGLDMQISNLLRYGVLAKAEELIVKGTGDIEGLETVGTAFAGDTGEDMATAISRAEAHLAATGWRGSHVVMNPNDWHDMRTQKRGSSDDAFVVGSWMSPPSMNAWGMQVAVSPSVTEGTSIVLDASQVAILDRMQAIVEFFRTDNVNVRSNLVTLRAEARMGFAVFAPAAVQLVTLP